MKQFYQQRFYWIFHYTRKSFWYCVAKTLCIVLGLPLFCVSVAVDMVLTAVNMLFCWIPVLNVVVRVVFKAITTVLGSTFYICILPDLKAYREAERQNVQYDVADADEAQTKILDEAQTEASDGVQDNSDDETVG